MARRRSSAGLACLLGLLLGAPAPAQEREALVGHRVEAIRFEGDGLDPAEALGYLEFGPGDRLSLGAVRRSVKLLYLLGLFGQVRVTARAAGAEGGLELTYHLEPKSLVRKVEVVGPDALSEAELMRLSRLQRGDEYDHFKLEASVGDMLSRYRRRGYRGARIVSSATPDGARDVRVSYFVQEGEPTRIARVELVGQLGLSSGRALAALGFAPGDVLDESALEPAGARLLARLRRAGYLDARIELPKLDPEKRVSAEVLRIEIQAGPRVELRVLGASRFRAQDLLDQLDLSEGLRLTPIGLRDQADRLEAFCRRQGHARVRVSPRLERDAARNLTRVVFEIEEGSRVVVEAIRFEGNLAFGQDRLRAYVEDAMLEAIPQPLVAQVVDPGDLDILGGGHPPSGQPWRPPRPEGFLFDLRPERIYLQEPYEKALRAISDLYLSQGYLSAEVGPSLLAFDDLGGRLFVDIPIREGPQTRVESITFEGHQALLGAELLELAERKEHRVRPGLVLNGLAVEELRRALQREYTGRGYVFCRVEQELVFSEDRSLAEVRYRFHEGPQVRVGRVLVLGNLATRRKVFDRLLSVVPGQLLTPAAMAKSQEDLLDLGVFTGVDVKMLEADEAAPVKDVVVNVRERMPNLMALSPGLSSGEGVRLTLEYTHRNLFGYGIESVSRAKVNYQVFYPLLTTSLADHLRDISFFQGLEWSLFSGLHWPKMWWVGRDVTGRIDLLGMHDLTPSYDLTKVSVSPGLGFKLAKDLSLNVGLELEYNSLGCLTGACGGATAAAWERYDQGSLLLLALRPEISWDRRDNPFNPHTGWFLSLRTELAKRLVAAPDASASPDPERPPLDEVLYLKLDGQVAGYIPLGRLVTVALMLRLGALVHLLPDSRTPAHKLFYLGGRNTVRGFREEGIIPADLAQPCVAGVCVSPGGDAFVLVKGELRFPLWPGRVDGAVFVDAGNLWQDLASFRPYLLRPSAGFGLRVVTPLGPVAFDVGFNLMPDESRAEDLWSFHFNVGVF
jgi:outer membrane protein assembly complex protein YaeT